MLLAESEEALQEMINHVADWCHNWRLMINVDKTKIVHFRKSTAPETTFLFRLCDFEIEKVQQYKYLGVYFDYCLTFKYATDVLSSSASRALGVVINKHKAIGGFGYSTYTKLFDNLVVPILDYGSGVWGTKSFQQSQVIQNKAIRSFLGVHKFTPNLAIQGDMGWDSSNLRQRLNVLRLWCRFIMMPASRLTKRIFLWDYELSMCGYDNWSSSVKTLLQETGQSVLYENIFTPIDVTIYFMVAVAPCEPYKAIGGVRI